MMGQPEGKVANEEDWSKEEICPPFAKAKIRAEKAAWEFYEQNKDGIEVSAVLPSLICGPIFASYGNTTETLIAEILKGSFPGIMGIGFSLVDIRDVAEAHFQAMFKEGTSGKRYVCSGSLTPFGDIFKYLKEEFEQYGCEINDKQVTAQEVVASGNPVTQRNVPMIGKVMRVSNERSKKELGMSYIPIDKTIKEMAHSLIKQGVVEKKGKVPEVQEVQEKKSFLRRVLCS